MDERDHSPLEALSEPEDREEDAIDEAAVAAFGQWYESQPPGWIKRVDALGRKGPVLSQP